MFLKQTDREDDEEFSDAPFTPDENRRFRKLLRDEGRVQYFWSTVRIWIGYLTAVIIAVGLAAGYVKDFVKGFVK